MKKFLFIIFLLLIFVVYFADEITEFAFVQLARKEGLIVGDLDLSWYGDGLNLQKLSIKKSDKNFDIDLKIENCKIKFDTSLWNYSIDVDNLKVKYITENIEKDSENESNSIALPLSKLFSIGLSEVKLAKALLEIQDLNYELMMDFSASLGVSSTSADMKVDGSINVSEKNRALVNANLTTVVKLFKHKLDFTGEFTQIQVDLNKNFLNSPLRFDSGVIQYSGSTLENLDTDLLIKFNNNKAQLDGLEISNINLTSIIKFENGDLIVDSKMLVKNIDGMGDFSDITFNSIYQSKDKEQISVKQAKLKFAEGSILIEPFLFDLTKKNAFKINFKKINLDKLTKTVEIDGLSVQGGISGWVTLAYQDGKIEIIDSHLQSTSYGGVIQYDPLDKTMLTNIASYIKLPPEYWGNFIFQKILVNVSNADKKVVFDIKISGSNPDFFNGRKVNLNSKIRLPIISLLKS
ncbi:MAG: YdbH domain-containing protein, partial [Legionellales bacterium]|nr:YdbH domain-containing protein [Legionellales bacterium]